MSPSCSRNWRRPGSSRRRKEHAGGYQLARPVDEITVLDVADALEGGKPLFQCREVRDRCVLGSAGASRRGVCAIHAVMLEGERRMREALAETTLADIAAEVAGKQAPRLVAERKRWFEQRALERRSATRRGHPNEDA